MKALKDWDDVEAADPHAVQQGEVKDNLGIGADEVEEDVPVQEEKEPEQVSEEKPSLDEVLKLAEIEADGKEVKAKVKVNGKEEVVALDELKKNYSGKVHWDKKFSELDKERKAFQKEKEKIDKYVNEFNEIAKHKNELEAVKYLAQITGKPAHEFVDGIIKTLLPEINRRQNLNEHELQFERQAADAKYQKEQLELEKKQLVQQKAEKELHEKIGTIKATKQLSDDEWDEAVRELDVRLPKSQDIYPETVSEYVDFKRTLRAERHLNIFNGGQLAQNTEVKQELIKVINDMPYLQDAEIQDILSKAFLTKQSQEVAKKLENKVSKQSNNKKSASNEPKPLESWNDL